MSRSKKKLSVIFFVPCGPRLQFSRALLDLKKNLKKIVDYFFFRYREQMTFMTEKEFLALMNATDDEWVIIDDSYFVVDFTKEPCDQYLLV